MLFPTTRAGRWSVGAFAGCLVLLAVFIVAVAVGERGGDEFFDNLWLTIPFLAAYVAAVAGFVLGVAAIAAMGERSIFVIAVTVLGLLVTTYGVLEIAFPH